MAEHAYILICTSYISGQDGMGYIRSKGTNQVIKHAPSTAKYYQNVHKHQLYNNKMSYKHL